MIEPPTEPLKVKTAEDVNWDESTDVLVVGFGGAGACAAIEAKDKGADVLTIDRFSGGGATALSGGIVYAGNTEFQREAGFADTPEEMFKYLSLEYGNVVSPETLQAFCDDSAGNIAWLQENGVRFASAFHDGKISYPAEDKYLYYSGNEAMSGYRESARPAPRGHRTYGKGWTGYVYFDALKQSALDKGVRFKSRCRASRLVIDDNGVVVGAEIRELPENCHEQHDRIQKMVVPFRPFNGEKSEQAVAAARALEDEQSRTRMIRARSGVVLATGGFAANLGMLNRYSEVLAANYKYLQRMIAIGCDGAGIDLGQTAGGATQYMDNLFVSREVIAYEGVLVNVEGQRFINEESYAAFTGRAIAEQPGGNAWVIVDRQTYRRLLWKNLRALFGTSANFALPNVLCLLFGGTKRGRTLDKIAGKTGVNARGLKASIEQYNRDIDSGHPDALGKSPDNCAVIRGPGYRAINACMSNRFGFTRVFSLGGLKVDEVTGQVLNTSGQRIPGLYAAGRAAVGICSDAYISGLSLADGVFSGRRAGRHCAQARD
ncbi:MAG: FAD-binding protein [bacterium]